MEYSDILKCLKALQECKNGNSKSCNKITEKCLKKLELKLKPLPSLKQIKNQNNLTEYLRYTYTLVNKIQQKYIEKLYDTTKMLNIFNYLQQIESNKNKKEDLEKIKKRIIDKENFLNNEIKEYLISLIEEYLKILQQNEENRRIGETTDSSPSPN